MTPLSLFSKELMYSSVDKTLRLQHPNYKNTMSSTWAYNKV